MRESFSDKVEKTEKRKIKEILGNGNGRVLEVLEEIGKIRDVKREQDIKPIVESISFLLGDILSLFLAGVLSTLKLETVKFLWTYPTIFIIYAFFSVYEKLYTRRVTFWDEILRYIKSGIFTFGVATIFKLSGSKIFPGNFLTLAIFIGLSISMSVIIRIILKEILFFAGIRRRAIVLGAGLAGRELLKALDKERGLGYDIIGYLDDDHQKRFKTIGKYRGKEIKVLGKTEDLEYFLGKVDEVIFAIPSLGVKPLVDVVNCLQIKVPRITVIPDLFGMPITTLSLGHFFDEKMVLLSAENNLQKPINIILKEIFDRVLGLIFFILSIPILIICAILIKLDSSGPIFFLQERVGKKGRIFKLIKFRTMYVNNEEILRKYLEEHPEEEEFYLSTGKLENDPRVTRIGRFLRKWSLDELPQFINVLKGDLSIVGPRPLIPEEVSGVKDYYFEWAQYVKPGITGLAQIMGRANISHIEKNKINLWYIRNWSLWLDTVIILKTILVVLKGEGAY